MKVFKVSKSRGNKTLLVDGDMNGSSIRYKDFRPDSFEFELTGEHMRVRLAMSPEEARSLYYALAGSLELFDRP